MGAWPVQVMVKDTGRTNGHRASFLCCGQSRRVHSLPRPPDHCRVCLQQHRLRGVRPPGRKCRLPLPLHSGCRRPPLCGRLPSTPYLMTPWTLGSRTASPRCPLRPLLPLAWAPGMGICLISSLGLPRCPPRLSYIPTVMTSRCHHWHIKVAATRGHRRRCSLCYPAGIRAGQCMRPPPLHTPTAWASRRHHAMRWAWSR